MPTPDTRVYGQLPTSGIQIPQWNNLYGKPFVTISPVGHINNPDVSVSMPNAGADFGPDSTLGGGVGQIGPPYTQTGGWAEAVNSGFNVLGLPGTHLIGVPVQVLNGDQIIAGSGRGVTILQATAGFAIPVGALNGHAGIIELGSAVAGATSLVQNVWIDDLTLDPSTLNSSTSVMGLHQSGTTLQHIGIYRIDCELGSASGGHIGIMLEALGGISGAASWDITIRDIFGHNGQGTVWVSLNAASVSSTYYGITIENIFNVVDQNGVTDDRVVVTGNFAAGSSGSVAFARDVAIRNVYVAIAAAVTSGTINGVKTDTGSYCYLDNFSIDNIYFWNASSLTSSTGVLYPYADQAETYGYRQNFSIKNVYAYASGGIHTVMSRYSGVCRLNISDVTLNGCTDAVAGIEVYWASGSQAQDQVTIQNVAGYGPVTASGSNVPVGIMLTGGSAGAGCGGATRISNVTMSNWQYGISNDLTTTGSAIGGTGWADVVYDTGYIGYYTGMAHFYGTTLLLRNLSAGVSSFAVPAGFGGISTPGVGTQTNTNPYPVRIYFLTSSSATFALADAEGNSSGSMAAVAGTEITLDPGCKITPSGTLTWKWYGA